ncbi:MAG TPA: FtsX-like permease family protein [Acidobacteriaceae bacterium]|jgi:putative ABC transport system permease protein|nr:FtsX-like permease family protein [Acidobacteriaceae bacterium]
MPSLSYSTAARIATRELRSSPGKFTFVLLSVAIGVAALTGVRGFSASFRSMLLLRARSIMAADIAARMSEAPTPSQQSALAKLPGLDETTVTEMLSMASSSTSLDPLLVALKAVDPAKYPFYGNVVLQPAIPLQQALTDSTVAVGDDLLLRLHLKLGDKIKLGNSTFRIAAVVTDEPDRLTGTFAAGPRILISQQALAATGLLAPGSRATRRLLFKLETTKAEPASDARVADLRNQLETILPASTISDYREANPSITRALDGATGLLSLMSLVALVLGAVGVAMAMRAHLQQRLDTIAIMKSLGAGSSQIIRIYLLQTLLLGLGGALLGLALGMGVQLTLPLFLARLLHLTPGFRLDANAALLGLGAGLLTTLLFTLPPLLDIRNVRPILILRRAVENEDSAFFTRAARHLRGSGLQLLATALILIGLAALAATVSDSRQVGLTFAIGLLIALLVLLGAAALTLWLLRLFLNTTRRQLPSTLRHGLANLYRPGNPSAALLAALGLGVMQIAAVSMVQRSIVGEMQATTAAKLPNLFLIDIASDEVAGVRALLATQPTVQGTPEIAPVVSARLTAINSIPTAELHLKHMPRRALNSLELTWPPTPSTPPPGDRVVSGQWWTAQQSAAAAQHPLVAIEHAQATRLNLRVGDHITFEAEDQAIPATVAALYEADSQHAFSRADFILPAPALRGLPVTWYGGLHCDPTATGQLRRVLYQHYPTITVIDVAATVETVRQVLLQITYVIQFLAAFSTFAGIVILASAIAGTRYRRIREVVVLKTLGATRPRIAAIFSIEFAVLGLIAALIGLLFANALARILLLRVFHFDYHLEWTWNLAALVITAALTVAAGWLASHRVLGQKPLEVLREE